MNCPDLPKKAGRAGLFLFPLILSSDHWPRVVPSFSRVSRSGLAILIDLVTNRPRSSAKSTRTPPVFGHPVFDDSRPDLPCVFSRRLAAADPGPHFAGVHVPA